MREEGNKSLVLSINDMLSDNQSSVEIAKTSKSVTYKVKCYNSNPDAARDKAVEIFNDLQEKYKVTEEC
jgi:uncharacterized protein YjhX (UPF0386 family)